MSAAPPLFAMSPSHRRGRACVLSPVPSPLPPSPSVALLPARRGVYAPPFVCFAPLGAAASLRVRSLRVRLSPSTPSFASWPCLRAAALPPGQSRCRSTSRRFATQQKGIPKRLGFAAVLPRALAACLGLEAAGLRIFAV